MSRIQVTLFVAAFFCCSAFAIGDGSLPVGDSSSLDSDKQSRLVEDQFSASVAKANAESDRARAAAAERRLTAYREMLKTATKNGEFDRATAIKSRLTTLEAVAPITVGGSRPKNIQRHHGHGYALIPDAVTWHIAKRRCEELGGHLMTLESPAEVELAKKLSGKSNVWIGASDELQEGNWVWLNGSKAIIPAALFDNYRGCQHHCAWMPKNNRFEDFENDYRIPFICEWDQ